ncbi:MAG: hypothetical protein J0M20_17605 [Burkholderiales bacterium]|nr:hypothetical protein [Burkholderiales bacterium]
MPNADDIRWFKTEFGPQIEAAVAGTPLPPDLVVAVACQETGSLWAPMRRQGLPTERIVALCVGDTLDADGGRRAFPRTRQELLAAPRGEEMFAIARQALLDMAVHVTGYQGVARRAGKFCHGFGVFQLDLQFFRDDPDYFLNRDYERFDQTLARCVHELRGALRQLGLEDRDTLSDLESAAVGIVYNTGGFKPAKGLKQGFNDGQRYYGEALFDYLRLAHSVAAAGAPATLPGAEPGQAVIAQPGVVSAGGPWMRVQTFSSMLRLRRSPEISDPPQANVLSNLPDGHRVRALTGAKVKGFIEVETTLAGALLRGFASAKYLVADEEPVEEPLAPVPVAPAVSMPRRPGSVTRRRDPANAHSLNERGQPQRSGDTADALRQSLGAIIDWLAVDDPAHLRYQPGGGRTFCNLYAHDYCTLAGAYLPRVWWTPDALLQWAAGQGVEPQYGQSIEEMRANDLFRWLRGAGASFGWRQTGTLTKLQTEVNQGAIGLVVARRKEDGRSGHIVAVVPETDEHRARRDAQGEVLAPLQSQAGVRNFRRSTGQAGWWTGEAFAEFAFWLHA